MANEIKRTVRIDGNSRKAVDAIESVTQAEKRLNAEIEQSRKAFDNADKAAKQRNIYTDNFGDISSATSALQSVGGGAASGLISDITGFVEYAPRLGESITDLAKRGRESIPAIDALSTAAEKVVPSLSGTAASIVGIGLAAAPVVLGLGAFSVAMSLVEETTRKAQEAALFMSETDAERARIQRDAAKAIEAGNVAEIETKKQFYFDSLSVAQAEYDRTKALRDQAEADYNDISKFNQKTQNKALKEQYQKDLEEAEKVLTQANFNLNAFYESTLDPRLDDARQDLQVFNDTIGGLSGTLNDATIASLKSAETEGQRANALLQAEAALTAERDRAAATLAQLEAQEAALIASTQERIELAKQDRFLSDNRAAQDRDISDRRQGQDLLRSQLELMEQHQDNLVNIAEQGADRVEDLQESVVDAQIDAYKQIDDATKDYSKAISEANEDYFKDAIDDQREFNRARKDAERDYQKDLKNAALENDVFAFLDAQDEKKEAIRDIRQDEKDAERERQEELTEAIEAAREANTERLEQINEELAAYTDKTNKEIAQIKTQTDTAIAESEREFQEKQTKDKALRDLQNQRDAEDLQLRQERLEQDRGIADARADAALAKQLADIDTKQLAEQAALDAFMLKITDIKTAIGTIGNTSTTNTTPTGWWNQLPMLGVTQPPLVLPPPPPPPGGTGDHRLNGQQSFGSGGGTAPQIVVNINSPNIGGAVSQDEVIELFSEAAARITGRHSPSTGWRPS